ncbi:MAG: exported protein of unknown function [Candidatus Saccharibacteria bacterium]|nr:exported protein of unknown function [Candidatus Saccharibacteria bacterium]
MKYWLGNKTSRGFSLVELIIAISVIAIITTISVVSYNGIQRRAGQSTMLNDLTHAADLLESSYSQNKVYPANLPADLTTSPHISLTISSTGTYSGLTPSQNALVLYNICNQMLTEGKGSGVNNGGTTEDYLTGCIVYNSNEYLHINGWSTIIGDGKFDVPISSTALDDKADSITYSSSYNNGKAIVQNFLRELDQRFVAQGGTYPVTVFWDSDNSPIAKPSLPAATPAGGWLTSTDYCVQAHHDQFTDLLWYVKPGEAPHEGTC